MTINDVAEK